MNDRARSILKGSAMVELAFDIASGANYKFNTAFLGEQARGMARQGVNCHPTKKASLYKCTIGHTRRDYRVEWKGLLQLQPLPIHVSTTGGGGGVHPSMVIYLCL